MASGEASLATRGLLGLGYKSRVRTADSKMTEVLQSYAAC